MSYWKRLVSGEEDNVLQFWTDVDTGEEIVIVDTTDNTEYKGNYAAFTSDEEKIGVYVEKTDLVADLYETKELLIEGPTWTDGEQEFVIVDVYPEKRSEGHSYHPPQRNGNYIYVKYIDSGEYGWLEEELFEDTVDISSVDL